MKMREGRHVGNESNILNNQYDSENRQGAGAEAEDVISVGSREVLEKAGASP